MESNNRDDHFFKPLFEAQKKTDDQLAPAFDEVFQKAQKQYRNMKKMKLLIAAGIGLLLLTAFAISSKRGPAPQGPIPIAKAGISLFERLENDGKIVTNEIYFVFDRADLKPESMSIVQEIASMMQEHPQVRLSVEGHTDDQGSDTYNQELSGQRAEAVRQALIGLSIAPDRLKSQGFGESKPVADNGSDAGRAKNRRVEFVRF